MSPLPLIARQRALARIGEIRLGDAKDEQGHIGRKLDTFRLTSQHQEILERAAELYGGTVKPWKSPTGDAWQVITGRSSLPVLCIPGYSLKRAYERWDGPSKRVRHCDGEEETISGEPCICNAQGKDECKLLTRLMVLLPETGTSLGWQLSSTGETAADELDLAMKIAEGIAHGRPFVPATLSLTQRKGQLDGKATRFVVPVLGFDPMQTLATGELPPAVPAGYTPITAPMRNGPSLREGLQIAHTQEVTRTPRSSAPLPDLDDDDLLAPAAPVAVPTDDAPPSGSDDLTKPQSDTLDSLVGQLRRSDHITTEQLWSAIANLRTIDIWTMVDLLKGRDEEGVLHWAPLRKSLTKLEASNLIDRLERLQANVQAGE